MKVCLIQVEGKIKMVTEMIMKRNIERCSILNLAVASLLHVLKPNIHLKGNAYRKLPHIFTTKNTYVALNKHSVESDSSVR